MRRTSGTLEYMKKYFPAVYAQLVVLPRQPRQDYKDSHYAAKFPERSGRTKDRHT